MEKTFLVGILNANYNCVKDPTFGKPVASSKAYPAQFPFYAQHNGYYIEFTSAEKAEQYAIDYVKSYPGHRAVVLETIKLVQPSKPPVEVKVL